MSIYSRLAALEAQGKEAVLVTVVAARGSVPRHEGSKMLVLPDGSIEGTIGGGEMEHRVIEEALAALKDDRLRVQEYTFQDPAQGDVGVCGGEIQVVIEPVKPSPSLLVIGAGHVGNAAAHLGKWLGFEVTVVDDRPEFAESDEVPDVDRVVACPMEDITDCVDVHSQTYVLMTTRGVDLDVESLPKLLATPAAYIGVIGSRRRWETTVAQLRQAGISEEQISRVTSPMGLELNAETPEEIAVSVLGQVIMLRRGGSGDPMAHKPAQRRSKGAESE
ncbi:MAG: XdhC family protein [Anaerolineales bacterium]|jgi:xanthine dehydrogenase accessory factor